MEAMTAQQAYNQIKEFVESIDKRNKLYKTWYVGIASDPKVRLFTEHIVSETGDLWIYCKCFNEVSARSVESDLLQLGCDGSTGGGDQSTTYVYAYKQTTKHMVWRKMPMFSGNF